jgi:hypothetical protein
VQTVRTVYIALAVTLLAVWLLLAVFGPRKLQIPGVLGDMRYGPWLRSLALALALAAPLIMVYGIWNFSWRNETRLNIAGVAYLATCIIMGLPLIEVTRTQVVVTEEGLTRFSPWSGPATLKWTEVERVRYSAANRSFVVDGAGRTISVSRHLAGIDGFAATVRRKLATERWASAAEVMQKLDY